METFVPRQFPIGRVQDAFALAESRGGGARLGDDDILG